MNTKHTPGPWKAIKSTAYYHGIKTESGKEIHLHEWDSESEANAKLMAAAPELLQSLELLYNNSMAKKGFAQSTTAIKIRAVIEKATQ